MARYRVPGGRGACPSPGSSARPGSGGPAARAPPGGSDLFGLPIGSDVGGAVAEPDPGAGRGDLHDRLGVVGHRVGQALLVGGDAAGGAVVERAVVQRDASTAGGVRSCAATVAVPSAPRIACGVSIWISKPQPARRAGRAPARAPRRRRTIAATCSTEVTLGRVTRNPSGSAGPRPAGRTTTRSRVRSPGGGWRLQALEPDPGERRPGRAAAGSAAAAAARAASRPPRRPAGCRSRPRSPAAGPRSAERQLGPTRPDGAIHRRQPQAGDAAAASAGARWASTSRAPVAHRSRVPGRHGGGDVHGVHGLPGSRVARDTAAPARHRRRPGT